MKKTVKQALEDWGVERDIAVDADVEVRQLKALNKKLAEALKDAVQAVSRSRFAAEILHNEPKLLPHMKKWRDWKTVLAEYEEQEKNHA